MVYFLTLLGIYFLGVVLLYLIYILITEEKPSDWDYSRKYLKYDLSDIFFKQIDYEIEIDYMLIQLYIWTWPFFLFKWLIYSPILLTIFIISGTVNLFSLFFDKFYEFVKGKENINE